MCISVPSISVRKKNPSIGGYTIYQSIDIDALKSNQLQSGSLGLQILHPVPGFETQLSDVFHQFNEQSDLIQRQSYQRQPIKQEKIHLLIQSHRLQPGPNYSYQYSSIQSQYHNDQIITSVSSGSISRYPVSSIH